MFTLYIQYDDMHDVASVRINHLVETIPMVVLYIVQIVIVYSFQQIK
jgi:hypothetical protein